MTDEELKARRKQYAAKYRASNRNQILARQRLHRAANRATSLARDRAYRDANRDAINARERARRTTEAGEKIRAKDRAYYSTKGDHFRAYRAQHKAVIARTKRAWVVGNQGAMRAIRFKRIAAEHRALPVWADLTAVKAIYEEAARLTRLTGVRHEVDHIVPIQSPLVCGLHISANMQILTKAENRQKSNHFTPHTGPLLSTCDAGAR